MPLMVLSSAGETDLQADEVVHCESTRATLWLGDASQGVGTLRVTSQRVLWVSAGGETLAAGAGYAFDYPFITMQVSARWRRAR